MITVKRFTASWCMPCRVLAPQFKQFEQEYENIKFDTIDVEENPLAAQLYEIRSVPTVIVEKDNQIVERIVGLSTKQKYVTLLDSLKDS